MKPPGWYQGSYPGFEEYGVPTQEEIDHYLAWKQRDDEYSQWLKDNPLQGCKDITAPDHMAAFDRVLRELYAPSLREALDRPSLLTQLGMRGSRPTLVIEDEITEYIPWGDDNWDGSPPHE